MAERLAACCNIAVAALFALKGFLHRLGAGCVLPADAYRLMSFSGEYCRDDNIAGNAVREVSRALAPIVKDKVLIVIVLVVDRSCALVCRKRRAVFNLSNLKRCG